MPLPLARTAVATALLGLASAACHLIAPEAERQPATAPARTANESPVEAHRRWWRAFVLADTGTLSALSTPDLAVTLSSGLAFDRAAAIAESQSHTTGARLTLEWSE